MEGRQSLNQPTDGELQHIITVAEVTARRVGANDAEADEVAQSTVFRFWTRWNDPMIRTARLRGAKRWNAYIRKSAINVYRDRIRAHQRRRHREDMASAADPTVTRRPGTSALTRVYPCPIEARMVRTLFAEAIETLPTAKQRQVARAVFLYEMSTAEVARELGIQPQAVRKHLRPARETLIAQVSEWMWT